MGATSHCNKTKTNANRVFSSPKLSVAALAVFGVGILNDHSTIRRQRKGGEKARDPPSDPRDGRRSGSVLGEILPAKRAYMPIQSRPEKS